MCYNLAKVRGQLLVIVSFLLLYDSHGGALDVELSYVYLQLPNHITGPVSIFQSYYSEISRSRRFSSRNLLVVVLQLHEWNEPYIFKIFFAFEFLEFNYYTSHHFILWVTFIPHLLVCPFIYPNLRRPQTLFHHIYHLYFCLLLKF